MRTHVVDKNTSVSTRSTEHFTPSSELDHDDDDGIWELVTNPGRLERKPFLNVGNLPINCTEEKLESFIAQRAIPHGIKPPKIYQCRIFVKDTHCAARLIIDAAFSGMLREFFRKFIFIFIFLFHFIFL